MELVDIGANLAHDSFDPDRDEVVSAAQSAGVVQLLITGSSLESTARARRLARERTGVLFATAGVHPHHAIELTPDRHEELRAHAEAHEVVAVGECGLDYFRDFSPRGAQREAFAAQLALAARLGKPVFLHERDAHEDFLAILREHRGALVGGVAHCFTGGRRELDAYLELGLHIGVTGWLCDERRGRALVDAAPHIPRERLLVETDAPYLLPRDLAPKPSTRRNEPRWLPHIVRVLARIRAEPPEELASTTTDNARRLFALAPAQSRNYL